MITQKEVYIDQHNALKNLHSILKKKIVGKNVKIIELMFKNIFRFFKVKEQCNPSTHSHKLETKTIDDGKDHHNTRTSIGHCLYTKDIDLKRGMN